MRQVFHFDWEKEDPVALARFNTADYVDEKLSVAIETLYLMRRHTKDVTFWEREIEIPRIIRLLESQIPAVNGLKIRRVEP